jgi:hypothetical protein
MILLIQLVDNISKKELIKAFYRTMYSACEHMEKWHLEGLTKE